MPAVIVSTCHKMAAEHQHGSEWRRRAKTRGVGFGGRGQHPPVGRSVDRPAQEGRKQKVKGGCSAAIVWKTVPLKWIHMVQRSKFDQK